MDFSYYPLKLTKRKNKLIIFGDERLPSTIAEEGDRVEMLAHALAAGAAGLTESQWQIAEGLGLSPETVKWYRKKLLVKFDVANTAELTSTAKDLGLV